MSGACPLVGGAEFWPSGGQGCVQGRLRAQEVFRHLVCPDRAVFPPNYLLALRCLRSGTYTGSWVGPGLKPDELEGGSHTMVLARISIHVVEGAPKNGCRQCICPHGEPLLNPPPSLHLQEAPQDEQVGLTQAPIKLLLFPWVLEHERICAHHLSEVSFPHSPVGLPKLSPASSQG